MPSDLLFEAGAAPAEPEVEPVGDKFLYERVAKVESTKYLCRIWCSDEMAIDLDVLKSKITNSLFHLESLGDAVSGDDVRAELLEICSVDGMNSVEIVIRATDVGMCVHKNWP